MAKKINRAALCQRWLHAWEEDTKTEQVFRPADYNFQLSRRPRESFELKPDGTVIEGTPSATDRVLEAQGTWRLIGDDQLAFYTGSQSEPTKKLRIVSASQERLVVKRSK
jgi:hypothetical protein